MSYKQCMIDDLVPFLVARGFTCNSEAIDPDWEQWHRVFENAGLRIVADQHERDDRLFLNIEDMDSVTLFYNGPQLQYETTITLLITICEMAEQRAQGFVRYREPVGGMLFSESFDQVNAAPGCVVTGCHTFTAATDTPAIPKGKPLTFIDEAAEITAEDMKYIASRPLPQPDGFGSAKDFGAIQRRGAEQRLAATLGAMQAVTHERSAIADALRTIADAAETECICGHSKLEHERKAGKCLGTAHCHCPGFLKAPTTEELPAFITQASSRLERSDALRDAARICECGHLKMKHQPGAGCTHIVQKGTGGLSKACECIAFRQMSQGG